MSVLPFAARTGGHFRRQNIRTTNSQAGPLCRWLLHNGPAFRWDLTKRSALNCLPKRRVPLLWNLHVCFARKYTPG
jgi:hypothetical protein